MFVGMVGAMQLMVHPPGASCQSRSVAQATPSGESDSILGNPSGVTHSAGLRRGPEPSPQGVPASAITTGASVAGSVAHSATSFIVRVLFIWVLISFR